MLESTELSTTETWPSYQNSTEGTHSKVEVMCANFALNIAICVGQEFWMGYAEVLKERGPGPFPGERNSPRFMTGTVAMSHAVVQHIKTTRPISGYIGGIFEVLSCLAIHEIFFPSIIKSSLFAG